MSISLWIDTTAFADKGGWKIDTQFILQMGQGYLLAAGKPGVPVADAATAVRLPSAGRYRVWARCRNWLREYGPGRFTIAVNGEKSLRLLGTAPGENWIWEIAGDFQLPAGESELRLIDESGYMARCAALLITDDFQFTPPQPVERLQALRARLLGLPEGVAEGGSYDVVVAGGGPGGVPAAVAAARAGQRTLLLHSRPALGGNASTEAGVGFDGASSRQVHAREGGIAEELRRIRDRFGCSWEEALRRLTDGQENLTIACGQLVVDAQMDGGRIAAVIAQDTATLLRRRFAGRMFIDCTGDGWLGFFAGAAYRLGREAAWEFGETLAPEQADSVTMSGCLMGDGAGVGFKAVDTGAPVPFHAPDWCYKFPPGRKWNRFVTGVHGHWWLEHQGDMDDLQEAERARDELYRISLSFFAWLKNDWDEKERAANYDIQRMPIYDAKRENRRFVGDYTLSERDCVEGRDFPDTIGHTGWTIDVHHPRGVFSGAEGPFHANMHIPLVRLPYRCLYSKNVDNLLFAGRCISVTHVALGTVRVQNTIAVAGQAAGTAAAIALRHGVTPRGVYQRHLRELQQTLLRDDQYIPGVCSQDEADLARTAAVSASSHKEGEPYPDMQGVPGAWIALDAPRAAMMPREEDEAVEAVWLYLRNEGASAASVTAHAHKERDPGLFWAAEDIAASTQEVAAGFEGFVRFAVGRSFSERYLWVHLDPAPGVSWRALDMAPLDWFKARREGGEFRVDGRFGMMMRLSAPPDEVADCSPAQAVNGYSRIVDARRYMWVSQTLPADLTLTWDREQTIARVLLTLDTDMNNPPMTFPQFPVHEHVATDFSLQARGKDGWTTIACVRDNYQRRVRIVFPPVVTSALRLSIEKTGGAPCARVLEIRCYHKP